MNTMIVYRDSSFVSVLYYIYDDTVVSLCLSGIIYAFWCQNCVLKLDLSPCM